ncbi:HtaA domain-containing protein [Allonocardiopsis opalescens]|uniref:Neocarzinostatin family protein n=1 Tax=Allonocardiopsis opalescens TaxID=1144618 RepID=A0A2T0Q9A9_9ACTN|nr:HtaA domain-containing protein [Allonocardiopsis opalescens]PRY00391.1 neocarzinostatin family protein [Allonocardiopsis opalescens]
MLEFLTGKRSRPLRRRTAAALAALAALAAGAVAFAPPAAAEAREVAAGEADWGVRASFRNYITGPIAHGSIEARDGATVNDDGTFAFPVASGSVEPETGAASVSFGGEIHFSGHVTNGVPLLEMTLSAPRVEFADGTGTLYADVSSRSLSSGEIVEYPDVDFAVLDLSAAPPVVDGEAVTWTNVPATLTENGAPAFADFYRPGSALDPFSLSVELAEEWTGTPAVEVSRTTGLDPVDGETVTVTGSGFRPGQGVYVAQTADPQSAEGYPSSFGNAQWVRGGADDTGAFTTEVALTPTYTPQSGEPVDCTAVPCFLAVFNDHTDIGNRDQDVWTPISFGTGPDPSGSPTPSPDPSGSAEPGPEPSAGGPAEITDGDLDWGVKESFRDYVTGGIAHGGWELLDGATESGGVFRFGSGTGEVDPSQRTLTAAFTGGVRFTGHDQGDGPLLDLTVENVSVSVDGDTGTLRADVSSRSLDGGEPFEGEQVELAALDLSGIAFDEAEDLVVLTGVPAVLTEEGAAAFAGFYAAGEALDPVSLRVAVGEGALPPGGGDPSPEPSATPPASGGGGLPVTGAAVAGVLGTGALLAGAGAGTAWLSRRRAAAAAHAPD